MKKRLGDFTFEDVRAICGKHKSCRPCPFFSGHAIESKTCIALDESREDELIDIPKCGECRFFGKEKEDVCCPNPLGEAQSDDYTCVLFEKKRKFRPFNDTDELVAEFKRRFNANVPDYAMPLIWVKAKDCSLTSLVSEFEQGLKVVSLDTMVVPLKNLFISYTFLDGSPCGVLDVDE